MKHILTVDQSTSATKAFIYDTEGKIVDKASLDHEQIYARPGWVEHDAEEIWQNTLSVLQTVLGNNPEAAANLLCLSITNQRETVVVFEAGTGRPLYNAMVWQCRRGVPKCTQLTKDGHEETVRKKTGLKIDTYFSASKLSWLIENQPRIAAGLKSGQALIGTIDSYLIYRLTGGRVHATDHTNASRTLLYNIESLGWDDELCRLFDVPVSALPEVRDCSARYGETDLDGFLSSPLPICGVIGDSQASLFAQRCFDKGMTKVTLGTGSSILLNIGGKPQLTESGAVTTIAWVHNGEPTYSFEGIINYSAAALTWLQNQLGLFTDPGEIETLATSVEDNGGVYLVPAFAGLSAPYWSPDARAAILGLTSHSNRGHVVRAALESIAYQIRDILEMMKTDAGVDLARIHADGGPTQNAFLMQFIADMADLETTASDAFELSPLGASLSGMLGMGMYSSLDDLAALPLSRILYRPQMEKGEMERLYGGWKEAVNRVL